MVDQKTGRIWLFATWNKGEDHESDIIKKTSSYPRLPYLMYSDDDGLTWSSPQEMSESCRDTTWGWYATGPGFGIQIQKGPYKGRLVIPANHSFDDPDGQLQGGPFSYGAHTLFSDDHGETWRMSVNTLPHCNESQLAELSDGTLIMNMRSYHGKHARAISYSQDGGQTWGALKHDMQLVESQCQGSILYYGEYGGKPLHFFTNPAVPLGRTRMTLRTSLDDTQSWTFSQLINAGPSAYSCLVKLPNDQVGLLYERGVENPYEEMVFQTIDIPDNY